MPWFFFRYYYEEGLVGVTSAKRAMCNSSGFSQNESARAQLSHLGFQEKENGMEAQGLRHFFVYDEPKGDKQCSGLLQ